MYSWIVFIAGIITLVGIYALMSLALNVTFGKAGLIDIGIMAFFGIGAYTYTLATIPHPPAGVDYTIGLHLPMLVGIVLAVLVAVFIAWIIGRPTLKLGPEYLAVATYALAEVIRYTFINERWLTNGVAGFHGLEQPFRQYFSGQSYQLVFMVFVILVVVTALLLLERMSLSPFGRSLKSIRENEVVANAIGKDVASIKMKAYLISAALAAISGSIYVWYATVLVPSMFVPEVTWAAWIGMIIGGKGNFKGVILGAFILIGAEEATRFFQASASMAPMLAAIRGLTMGILMVVIIRFLPRGVLPEQKVEM